GGLPAYGTRFNQISTYSTPPTKGTLKGNGYLTFDVSSTTYTYKKLTLVASASEALIIDGDSIPVPLVAKKYGNGFVIEMISVGSYIIKGDFNIATVWSPSYNVSRACLEENLPGIGCINFNNLLSGAVYNDNTNYPAGSTILSEGDLKIIKTKQSYTSSSPWAGTDFNFFTGTQELALHGYITFDLSNSTSVLKRLTVESSVQSIMVDGDSLYLPGFTAFPYTTSNFDITQNGSEIIIEGNFNQAIFHSPTLVVYNACYKNIQGCLDFTTLQSDVIYNNNTNYPAGSTIISNGDLKVVKTKLSGTMIGQGTEFQFFSGVTQLSGFGYFTLDVSNASYTKRLTAELGAESLIIDGDSIHLGTGFSSPYAGSGFTLERFGQVFIVTGNFNQVIVHATTTVIYSACLDNMSTIVPIVHVDSPSELNSINPYNGTSTETVTQPSSTTNASHTVITPNHDGLTDGVNINGKAKIYDRNGRLVKSIEATTFWEGTDNANKNVPTGYYTVIMENGNKL
ncbi:MAG: hypothetical protein ACPGDB_03230, partial [Fusobacterium sp.]